MPEWSGHERYRRIRMLWGWGILVAWILVWAIALGGIGSPPDACGTSAECEQSPGTLSFGAEMFLVLLLSPLAFWISSLLARAVVGGQKIQTGQVSEAALAAEAETQGEQLKAGNRQRMEAAAEEEGRKGAATTEADDQELQGLAPAASHAGNAVEPDEAVAESEEAEAPPEGLTAIGLELIARLNTVADALDTLPAHNPQQDARVMRVVSGEFGTLARVHNEDDLAQALQDEAVMMPLVAILTRLRQLDRLTPEALALLEVVRRAATINSTRGASGTA